MTGEEEEEEYSTVPLLLPVVHGTHFNITQSYFGSC